MLVVLVCTASNEVHGDSATIGNKWRFFDCVKCVVNVMLLQCCQTATVNDTMSI